MGNSSFLAIDRGWDSVLHCAWNHPLYNHAPQPHESDASVVRVPLVSGTWTGGMAFHSGVGGTLATILGWRESLNLGG